MKVSQLKAELQSIIKNIKQLEELKNETVDAASNERQQHLINETSALLSKVESQPKRRLRQILKKRQNKRIQKKKKRKQNASSIVDVKQTVAVANVEISTNATQASINIEPSFPVESVLRSHSQHNEFHQLRNYQQAQKYLRKFELLEMLHYARSQDKQRTQEFRENFHQLRTFWNSVLLESTPKRTEARRIEDQWNEVLFGAREQTFYGARNRKCERERMHEFLKIRRTWDNYLVRNKKQGSSIPLGWVLPNHEVSESWAQYRMQE